MKHIVILGGGFGGVYTTKYLLSLLKNRSDVKITLVSRDNYFLFTPLLHEVATGGLNRHNIVEPIRNLFTSNLFEFVKSDIKEVDFPKKIVHTGLCDISYDYLVIALGSTTNFYGIPGAQEHCLDLKNIEAAAAVRNRIIDSLETASKSKGKDIRSYLTFTVVGGGPTGVELAAEVADFVRQMLRYDYHHLGKEFTVHLVQRGETILPFISASSRQKAHDELIHQGVTILLGSEVTKVFPDGIEINHTKKIPASTIVWTSGIRPRQIAMKPSIVDARGFIPVNKYLQVPSQKNVFALGDCALFTNPGEDKPVPALAQTATIQARYVARNIVHALKNKPLEPCRVRLSGLLVSVGQRYAVAELLGVRLSGFLAWWIWRTIYLFKLVGRVNKIRVAIDWTMNLFSKRDTSQL